MLVEDMCLFWWQHLPLLLFFQILESTTINHRYYAEALPLRKSTVEEHNQQFFNWIERYPSLRLRTSDNRYDLNDPEFLSANSRNHLQKTFHGSRRRRIAASVGGDSAIPTLTPAESSDVKKQRKHTIAAIVGGVGATLLVVVVVVLVYICLMRIKNLIRRTSESASSFPSPPADLVKGNASPYSRAVSPYNAQNFRELTIVELKHATRNFNPDNILGQGVFGLAYKGLLEDGTLVAVKRSLYKPTQNLFSVVKHLSLIHHKHLVKFVGYCEDGHQQLLVYDYMSNGNVGTHLYDHEGLPIGKLNMRQRLSIACGAARGLEHLHSLAPPLLHMHFRTSNVLLDENFTAKVSDYGLSKFVLDGERAGSSSVNVKIYTLEISFGIMDSNYTTRSDVYSFGVFLLELVSSCEAHGRIHPNLVSQARSSHDPFNLVDKSLGKHSIAAEELMKLALQCIDRSVQRPLMKKVVEQLEQIQEREIGQGNLELGEDIGEVKLGSELFK
ncbi:hypothetical protein ACFE04_011484 [Oxalis oulophora]